MSIFYSSHYNDGDCEYTRCAPTVSLNTAPAWLAFLNTFRHGSTRSLTQSHALLGQRLKQHATSLFAIALSLKCTSSGKHAIAPAPTVVPTVHSLREAKKDYSSNNASNNWVPRRSLSDVSREVCCTLAPDAAQLVIALLTRVA